MQGLLIFPEVLHILLINACESVSGYRVIFSESVDTKKNVIKSLVSTCSGKLDSSFFIYIKRVKHFGDTDKENTCAIL